RAIARLLLAGLVPLYAKRKALSCHVRRLTNCQRTVGFGRSHQEAESNQGERQRACAQGAFLHLTASVRIAAVDWRIRMGDTIAACRDQSCIAKRKSRPEGGAALPICCCELASELHAGTGRHDVEAFELAGVDCTCHLVRIADAATGGTGHAR